MSFWDLSLFWISETFIKRVEIKRVHPITGDILNNGRKAATAIEFIVLVKENFLIILKAEKHVIMTDSHFSCTIPMWLIKNC